MAVPLAEWAPPASCTDVRTSFVCLANYYRKFVAASLTTLSRCSGTAPPAQASRGRSRAAKLQRAEGPVKAALTSARVLLVWDSAASARPTSLLTDASELVVSAILEQPNDNGAFHPVAFELRKLNPPERSSRYQPHLL